MISEVAYGARPNSAPRKATPRTRALGAYGRLAAWRSMAGLGGAPADASAQEVEDHARRSTWFHFEADADWFHNEIGDDYGIAALPPDGRRIAVLAATDTD
ncbi:DUF6183 family protein [Streptantibioticus ferralitis]|uniref:DUF6183 family protein n=1 Tax=Streptantibioticus ferralitis TaxID=236510 RepID=A0ABT5Z8Q2_9ACTN|nr:DUF6183 family protein [Streptantibioticus ferralitis]MDF2260208.1 DUF6183 family protein [Streptantibioticus ferralitis]